MYLVLGFYQPGIWTLHQKIEASPKAQERILVEGVQSAALNQVQLETGVIEVAQRLCILLVQVTRYIGNGRAGV